LYEWKQQIICVVNTIENIGWILLSRHKVILGRICAYKVYYSLLPMPTTMFNGSHKKLDSLPIPFITMVNEELKP